MTKVEFDKLILQNSRASFDEFSLLKARELVRALDESELEALAFELCVKSSNKAGFYGLKELLNALAGVLKERISERIKRSVVKRASLPRLQLEFMLFGYFLKRECARLPKFASEFLKTALI